MAGTDSSGDELIKGVPPVGMNRAQAAPMLTASELDAIPVLRWTAVDSNYHDDAHVEVDKRYVGVDYRTNMVDATAHLART